MQTTKIETILALDVGEKRVGVAIANTLARLPRPLTTLERGETFWQQLGELISGEGAVSLVVGLPRNLKGGSTAQTATTEAFIAELQQRIGLPVTAQDEALTSHQAETELSARGKPYQKGDIDALAATYILEDYLHQVPHA